MIFVRSQLKKHTLYINTSSLSSEQCRLVSTTIKQTRVQGRLNHIRDLWRTTCCLFLWIRFLFYIFVIDTFATMVWSHVYKPTQIIYALDIFYTITWLQNTWIKELYHFRYIKKCFQEKNQWQRKNIKMSYDWH